MDKLLDILGQSSSLPFLFIGSGFSRRYLNLPNWKDLLRYLAWLASDSEYAYAKYEQKAKVLLRDESSYNMVMAKIADLIEADLSNVWYDSPKFTESRELHKDLIDKGISPLKIEISRHIHSLSQDEEKFLLKEEIEQLKHIGIHSIAGIITTNYDHFLENVFKFNTYASQDDLIFSTTYNLGEIYKIHGCIKKPETIVINSSDYEDATRKNKYLASKLLTIFVEHPIVFIGYSLQDEDVKQILEAIVECLDREKLNILSKRLIFIEWVQGLDIPEFGTSIISFQSGKDLAMTSIKLSNFSHLYSILAQNKAKYPTTFLRKLKQDIYTLVLTNDPKEKLKVLTSEAVFSQGDAEYVVGFGILELGKRGYRSIDPQEIFRDIIFNEGNYNNKLLAEEVIPRLLRQTANSLPFYKYIIDIPTEELPEKIRDNIKNKFDDFKSKTILRSRIEENSIREVLENEKYINSNHRASKIAHLKETQIDVTQLHQFLIDVLQSDPNSLTSNNSSNLKRLIKMYDWLKYYKMREANPDSVPN